jgi:hypothetical protein
MSEDSRSRISPRQNALPLAVSEGTPAVRENPAGFDQTDYRGSFLIGIVTIAKAGTLELLDRNRKIAKTKIRSNYIPFVFKQDRGITTAGLTAFRAHVRSRILVFVPLSGDERGRSLESRTGVIP